MKKFLLKTVSLILVLILSFVSAGMLNAYAADDEPEFPCGGVIEEVDVKILYAPLTSRVVIGRFGPVITGTVLKVTYPDGKSEILTVVKDGGDYYAGDFSVYISYFDIESIQVVDYGILKQPLQINKDIENFVGYSGETDFLYLILPSFAEIIYLISAYCRIISWKIQ